MRKRVWTVIAFLALIGVLISLIWLIRPVTQTVPSQPEKSENQPSSEVPAVRPAIQEKEPESETAHEPDESGEKPVSEPEPKEQTVPVEASDLENEIDFATWKSINPDVYAWIRVPGTMVDYPVVQREDDDGYYLRLDIEGKSAVGGTIFTEPSYNSRSFEDPVTVIYGHSMRNGTMFGSLQGYAKTMSFDEHPVFYVYTPEEKRTYRIVAGVPYGSSHILYYHDFSNETDYRVFFDELFSTRSLHANIKKDDVPVYGDKVVILSTCLLSDSEKRYLLIGILENVTIYS